MTEHVPTDEQRAILHEIQHGRENVMINALAGCAKTWTLLAGLKVIPQQSILFAAFNKGIADEARARLPKLPKGKLVVVQTFHALGREIILKHYPRLQLDRRATEDLVKEACAAVEPKASFEVRLGAMRLVRYAKEGMTPRASWPAATLLAQGYRQLGNKLKGQQAERAALIAQRAMALGADAATRRSIDFCDLVWLPSVLDLAPPARYQAILLDEAQDVSEAQAALIERVSLPTTRVIAAGDEWQQLYSWRGSLGGDALARFSPKSGKRFPLTTTWRCARAVVAEAQHLVSELRARPGADEGSVSTCNLGDLPLRIAQGQSDQVHTFVLSRNNQALLDCALFLWRSGVKFMLNAGQDLLEPLFDLLNELDLRSESAFRRSLTAWHDREARKADAAGATGLREQLDEQRAMLLAALRYAPPNRIRRLLGSILQDNKSGVLLSTPHKVKGLEAERVFLLRETFARHHQYETIDLGVDDDTGLRSFWIPNQPKVDQEELNIEYVAITRARLHLIWVDTRRREQPELLAMPLDKIPSGALEDAYGLHERAIDQAEAAGERAEVDRLLMRLKQLAARLPRLDQRLL